MDLVSRGLRAGDTRSLIRGSESSLQMAVDVNRDHVANDTPVDRVYHYLNSQTYGFVKGYGI